VGKLFMLKMLLILSIFVKKKHSDIDLILMDIKIPIMDGYNETREIRKFNKDVIIIAQTTFAFEGDKEKAIESGCNDYVIKPLNVKKRHDNN
jgi:CheY-like chemotaxis protein